MHAHIKDTEAHVPWYAATCGALGLDYSSPSIFSLLVTHSASTASTKLSLPVCPPTAFAIPIASVSRAHTRLSTQRTTSKRERAIHGNCGGHLCRSIVGLFYASFLCRLPCSDLPCLFSMDRPFHNRVCKPWTECAANQYEVVAPSASQDRVCSAKTSCDVRMERIGRG